MADEKEVRITQMKMVMENRKMEQQIKLEKLRHKNVMEALKFMKENNITSFNLSLSDKQMKRIKADLKQT